MLERALCVAKPAILSPAGMPITLRALTQWAVHGSYCREYSHLSLLWAGGMKHPQNGMSLFLMHILWMLAQVPFFTEWVSLGGLGEEGWGLEWLSIPGCLNHRNGMNRTDVPIQIHDGIMTGLAAILRVLMPRSKTYRLRQNHHKSETSTVAKCKSLNYISFKSYTIEDKHKSHNFIFI